MECALRVEEIYLGVQSIVQTQEDTVQNACRHIVRPGVVLLMTCMEAHGLYDFGAGNIEMIATLSDLHDLGKLLVPPDILCKRGRLDADEWEIMRKHTAWGAELIDRLPMDNTRANRTVRQIARNICLYHHERWDGKGYPYGLKRNEIPIEAQVVSVIDVYDALRQERCYRGALSHEEAVHMVLSGQCGCFSPRVHAAFCKIQDELKKTESEVCFRGTGPSEKADLSSERYRDLSVSL